MERIDSVTLANKDYVAEQYRRYKADPRSVGEEWALFFAGFELGASSNGAAVGGVAAGVPAATSAPVIGVFDLVHSYRELGHLVADLNPLAPKPAGHPLLEPSEFGFGDEDLDRVVSCGGFRGCSRASIRDLIARLQATYCGTLGVEYMHIQAQEQRVWLQERMDTTSNRPDLSPEDRLRVLDSLITAEGLEQFLQLRYPTAKRFSLEGSDSLVPLLHTLIEDAGMPGVEEMVFGMSHRGRINVLANVLRKPYEMIIAEFEGSLLAKEATGDGDVKYHLGYSRDHTTRAGRKVHLSLAANPSHLEAIDPIIEGMVRAKQQHLHDAEYARVVPVLMHGDASFTGQGVVAETLGLSELDGYRTGGTVHIIVNNQIGFTTPPEAYRFTPYPSDVAKIIQAPVFHVNGDDPEAAVQAARLAIGFRQRFKKDVFIDLVCYRRHGHNELDDPTFTQPVMYKKIAAKRTPLTLYREQLVQAGAVAAEEAERRAREFRELLDDAQSYARDFMPRQPVFVFGGLWKGFDWAGDDWSARTAVAPEVLHEIAAAFTRLPGVEVAAHERPRAAPPARLRGPGPRALERAPRALPPALRRGQHAGLQPDHAGAVLPRPPPPDAPELPEAARADEPEEPAAPQALRLAARGADAGRVPDRDRRHRARRRARGWGHDRARRGAAHPALQRQDLLRAPRRAPRARHRLRGARARRAALPLPGEGARGHLRRLPRSASGVLGAGGAVEHGRVARHVPAAAAHPARGSQPQLRRTPRGREPRDRLVQAPPGRGARAGERRARALRGARRRRAA